MLGEGYKLLGQYDATVSGLHDGLVPEPKSDWTSAFENFSVQWNIANKKLDTLAFSVRADVTTNQNGLHEVAFTLGPCIHDIEANDSKLEAILMSTVIPEEPSEMSTAVQSFLDSQEVTSSAKPSAYVRCIDTHVGECKDVIRWEKDTRGNSLFCGLRVDSRRSDGDSACLHLGE